MELIANFLQESINLLIHHDKYRRAKRRTERRNDNLTNMLRSMILPLPELQREEVSKMSIHILNQVCSEEVPKSPYELWTIQKPSLRHFHVLGYLQKLRFIFQMNSNLILNNKLLLHKVFKKVRKL